MAEKSEVIKINVCQGLGASNTAKISIDKLNKPNNYFEYMGEGKIRVFIDIDGAVSYEGFNKKAFKECDNANIAALMTIPDVGIMSASHYDSQKWVYNYTTKENEHIKTCPKFSYRITYINEYFEDSNAEMLEYVKTVKAPELKALFKEMGALSIGNNEREGTILDIDESVYKGGKSKMRCVNAYKDREQPDRINRIIKGELCDQLLTYIPEEAKLCKVAGFVGKPKKVKATEESKESKSEDNITETKITKKRGPKPANLPTAEEKIDLKQFMRVIDGLKPHRWQNYYDWIRIYWIFINEGINLDIFEEYSERYFDTSKGKYSRSHNENIYKANKCDAYKIATLYFWLKEDNYHLFMELQASRRDFWQLVNNLNHSDLANLYYSAFPDKYLRSSATGWYEYNEYNRLLREDGGELPTSMLNHITLFLQKYINTQKKNTDPEDKEFIAKMKSIKAAYNKVSDANYVTGIQKYLKDLYTKRGIDKLFDSKNYLLAFNNGLYDIRAGCYRDINPDDYITKTTGYNMPTTNKADYDYKEGDITKNYIDVINGLVASVFDNEDVENYYKIIMGLSFFTNRLELLIIHTGTGGNGKGFLASIFNKALGEYHQTADPAFLSTKFESQKANSTLSDCKGKRMLMVPEVSGGKDGKLNEEFIKSLTGRDEQTTRHLGKGNFSFDPLIVTHIQTNNIPKISSCGPAWLRRLLIFLYTREFVTNPTLPHHKKVDDSLKDIITNDAENKDMFKKAFMYVFIEKAQLWYARDINELPKPKGVTDAIAEYAGECDPLKDWIPDYLEVTNDKADRIPTTELHKFYNKCPYVEIHYNSTDFKTNMKNNGYPEQRSGSLRYYGGLKYKVLTNKDGLTQTTYEQVMGIEPKLSKSIL